MVQKLSIVIHNFFEYLKFCTPWSGLNVDTDQDNSVVSVCDEEAGTFPEHLVPGHVLNDPTLLRSPGNEPLARLPRTIRVEAL